MGKGKGGGGSVPKVKVPSGLYSEISATDTLGNTASGTLGNLLSYANWAGNIASGGNVVGTNPYQYSSFTGGVGGAQQYPGFFSSGVPGQGGTPGVQSAGPPGSMIASPGMAPATLSQSQIQQLTQAGFQGFVDQSGKFQGFTPGMTIDPGAQLAGSQNGQPASGPTTVKDFFGQALGGGPAATGITGQRLGMVPFTGGGGTAGGGSGGGSPQEWSAVGQEAGLSSEDIAAFQKQGLSPSDVAARFGVAAPMTQQQQQDQLLGPFLSRAWNTIGQELQGTGMFPGLMQQTQGLTDAATAQSQRFMGQGDQLLSSGQGLLGAGQRIVGQGQDVFKQGQGMLTDATTGAGLYPSQKAFVDQAVQSQKTSLAAQLASEGLGSSTMLQQMKGQADLSGAATAGQLVQGNISAAQAQEQLGLGQQQAGLEQQQVGLGQESQAQQQYNLGQASQKIALGGQELSLGEQAALTQELAAISSQSSGLQNQMWSQAMQGYGMFGQIMQTALGAYGYSMQGYSQIIGASSANASAALQAQMASAQSQSQGMSSMMGGLGQLLGSGGSGAV